MTETELKNLLQERLTGSDVDDDALEALAGQLVWRIGRLGDDAPVTVRVGLPSSVPYFNDLPKLRSASEEEIAAAVAEGNLRVEWVGRSPA